MKDPLTTGAAARHAASGDRIADEDNEKISHKKRLLMTSPWPRYARMAKEQGFHLTAVWPKEDWDTLMKILPFCDELHVVDMNDTARWHKLIAWLHEQEPFDFIYHLGRDEQSEAAYQIAEKLSRALNPVDTVRFFNDKYRMRQLLAREGVSTVRFELAESVADVRHTQRSFGYPFIVKPTALSGSRGVFLCRSETDVTAWEALMSAYRYSGPFIIEEYLEGPEVSVESLSFDGEHHIIGITDKLKTPPPLFVETGHVHPSQLPEPLQMSIAETVRTFLKLADYRFGPAHTELILTGDGPKIVESQARMGGDNIPLLVELSTGVAMETEIFRMLNGHAPARPERSGVAIIRYFEWPRGTVDRIDGLEQVAELPFVMKLECRLNPGDVIPDVRDSASRYGYVVVSGANDEEAIERIDRVLRMITIRLKPEH